jgi:hypothetical protein
MFFLARPKKMDLFLLTLDVPSVVGSFTRDHLLHGSSTVYLLGTKGG